MAKSSALKKNGGNTIIVDGVRYFKTAQDQYNELVTGGGGTLNLDYGSQMNFNSNSQYGFDSTTNTVMSPGGVLDFASSSNDTDMSFLSPTHGLTQVNISRDPNQNFDYSLDSGFFPKNPPSPITVDSSIPSGGSGFGSRFAGNLKSPQAMAGIAQGIGGIIQGLAGRGKRRRAQAAAQDEYDRMLRMYKDLDTSNLYADVENQYTNLENAYEDLTVNRQQAEFERDMFRQQQANIMSNLSAAAGGSGIASLAQAMANQASIQARSSSATIGQQERQNQLLRAREASRLQLIERRGEQQAEAMRLRGAETARGLEYRQTGTLLGMSQQRLAAANQAIAQANAALYSGIGSLVGTVATAGIGAIPTPAPVG